MEEEIRMATTSRTVSPFIFDGPLPPEEVFGRRDEVTGLLDLGRAGRFVRLYAPRRYGKTSLLRKMAEAAGRQRPAMPVVMVDLFGLVSIADLAVRLESGYRELPDGKLRRHVASALAGAGLGFSLAGAGISAQFAQRPTQDPLPALHTILDLPLRAVPSNTRAVIVFDEFQAIRSIRGLDAILRSHVQHQRKHASFVFCGSEQGMLDAIFNDPAAPMYGQYEPMRLGRLPAAIVADEVVKKFAETGRDVGDALSPLILIADGHPQRAMLLSHLVWGRTRPNQRATVATWEQALADALTRTRPELEVLWERLSTNDQRVLRAIGTIGSPFRKEAAGLLDLKKSSARDSVRSLMAGGVLELRDEGSREGSPVDYRIVDPLLAQWMLRRFPTL
jgi:uncharacterized protein